MTLGGEPLLGADLNTSERRTVARLGQRKERLREEIRHLKEEVSKIQAELAALDAQAPKADTAPDDDEALKARQLNIGKKKFNMDPKKGLQYLTDNGLIQLTPEAVAKFLLESDMLSKTAIGDYLGELKEFNLATLQRFVDLQKFGGMTFDTALRKFLSSFRLPGEAQKIDRMMERFADKYCKENTDVFAHPDTCYVLAFSIIMLNTDLHNPSIKNKITLEGFIKNNRGINQGQDLAPEFLSVLYDRIKNEELEMPKDEDGTDMSYTFFNPEREGWLTKQGGRKKNWRKRWFVLTGNCLYYFKETADPHPLGIIPLEDLRVRDVSVASKRAHCFEIYNATDGFIKACKTSSDGTVVEGRHERYLICAANGDEMNDWINSINASIKCNPIVELQRIKKAKVTDATI
ncbi:cytohesin 1 [Capsaspora owczarzaki ATCC 30864]|uniref:Cytohesin 1 n=1 Tax=Capsaspora owczarzaki (strain ATCC 30864) TaxID=595528 RepID=A0A0D2WVY4_CAPO3|nr:cytohesin 1 [Capsaspora owczarzaki ATCC 30864]KJE96523.1 cytohesin 1 [Capsaspora owczarzaki ATCC 30864]|eukprot:XP_004344453.2 cytohesin 1 [Capsaspora owczarzaki ATCC 30864]